MIRIIENYPNYTISDKGEIVNTNTNKELKPYIRKDGYVISVIILIMIVGINAIAVVITERIVSEVI